MPARKKPKSKKTIERKEWGPWTVPEYGRVYNVCPATVYRWMGNGWLKSSKIGGSRRIMPIHDEAFRERFSG